jgi:hypothetical protein
MARKSTGGLSRGWSVFFALVMVLGGMAVSLGLAAHLHNALQRSAEIRMTDTSAALQSTVSGQLSAYTDTVRASAAGLNALPTPTAAGFTGITSAIVAQHLPAAVAVRFLVPASPDQLGAVAATWRSRGVPGLTIDPVKGARQHLFTVFTRGLNGGPATAIGADQAATPAEVEGARLARTAGGIALSDPYLLPGDAALPPPRQQVSFDVLAPVYETGDRTPAGYLSLSVRGTDLLTASLSAESGGLLDATLLTRSASGLLTQVARVSENRTGDVRRTQTFHSGQREWVLGTTTATRALLPDAARTDLVVLPAGCVLAVLLGALLYLGLSAAVRREERIDIGVAERLTTAGVVLQDLSDDPRRGQARPPDGPATAESKPEPGVRATAARADRPTAGADEPTAAGADEGQSRDVPMQAATAPKPGARGTGAAGNEPGSRHSGAARNGPGSARSRAAEAEPASDFVTIEGELVVVFEPGPTTTRADRTPSRSDLGDHRERTAATGGISPGRRPSVDDGQPEATARAVRGRRPRRATQPTVAPKELTEPARRARTARPRRNERPAAPPVSGPGHVEADNVAETLRYESGQTGS